MTDSMLPVVNTYYKSSDDQNCIPKMSEFFTEMDGDECVVANFNGINGERGVTKEKMTNISNHLSSSRCWSSVEDWKVDVEYTIDHPLGNIVVSDNKLKNIPSAIRKESVKTLNASFPGSETCIEFERFKRNKAECAYTNMTKSSFVKITKSKCFVYSTKNSSWIYKLSISWEGVNKEEAEVSEKKYYVTIETNDTNKASFNSGYTSVSFLEKVLDVEFINVGRKLINFF